MRRKKETKKRLIGIALVLSILLSTMPLLVKANPGIIYIREDGSIDPPTAPIQRDGMSYTLTGNIMETLVIQKDNIALDGAGYTVQGTGEFGSIGIDLTDRNNVKIKNTIVAGFGWSGIYLSDSSGNLLTYNILRDNSAGITLAYGSQFNTCSGNTLEYNDVGFSLSQAFDNVFSNNIVTNNDAYGFDVFGGSERNTISKNTISNNGYAGLSTGYAGIGLFKASYNTISDNKITNNKQFGVDMYANSDYNTVSGNNITEHDVGIAVRGSSNEDISSNIVTDSLEHGIYVSTYSGTTVSSNVVSNSKHGIFLTSSPDSVRVFGNELKDNYLYGIYVHYTNQSSITDNDIVDNNYGIGLMNAFGNSIHHNDFINNAVQVKSTTSANTWDDGYPSGGNYWSDYTGIDEKQGPNQDQPGSDNIGDTPYVIDVNNIDHYPLMRKRPIATLSASKATVIEDIEGVTFDARTSYDPDGSVVAYLFDWGDGFNSGWVNAPVLYRIYPNPGEYFATVTVKDNDELTSESSDPIKITVIPYIPPIARLEVEMESNVDKLYAEKVETTITVKIRNVGDYAARDINLKVTMPPNFEASVNPDWFGDLQPGEEKIITFDAKAISCVSGTFQAGVTFKDVDDATITLPTKLLNIEVTDWILIQHYGPNTKINLSPTSRENAKNVAKAENIIAAVWVTTLILDLGLTELEAETLIQYADEFIAFLRQLWEDGEVDEDVIAMIIDWIASVALNTMGLWIVANYREDLVKEDGTVDFNAVWILSAIADVLNDIIDNFVGTVPETTEQTAIVDLLILQETQGRLYLNVNAEGKQLKTNYGDNTAVVLLPPRTSGFNFTVDAKDAHEDVEQYNIYYWGITSKDVKTKELIVDKTIHKSEKQTFKGAINLNRAVTIEEIGSGNLAVWIVLATFVAIIAVGILTLIYRKRRRPK